MVDRKEEVIRKNVVSGSQPFHSNELESLSATNTTGTWAPNAAGVIPSLLANSSFR